MRRLTGIRKIGHTGTLDPFAEGLLPICIGRATAAVQVMDGYDKTYRVGVEFGRTTDTQDLTGQTTGEYELTAVERAELVRTDFARVRAAVAALAGTRQQTPPMYSAVKLDGRPLYEYARRGQAVERKSRQISVYRSELDDVGLNGCLHASVTISCSKGTYIRTLAEDLGQALGYGAHAASLTRLQCGPFSLDEAQDLDRLFAMREECPDNRHFLQLLADCGIMLPIDRAFSDFPAICLPEADALRLICGQPLLMAEDEFSGHFPDCPIGSTPIVVRSEGRLIAMIRLQKEQPGFFRLKTERVLIDLADFRQA
jgi:tRNA pseudouridine55 synthase